MTRWTAWLRRGGLVIAAVILAITLANFLADPFGLKTGRRTRAALEDAHQLALQQARHREEERQAAREVALTAADLRIAVVEVGRATASASQQARSDKDAQTALGPDRMGRLVGHDRRLCQFAPDLVGCPAAD